MKENKKDNPFVGIGASIGGIFMIIALFTLLFASQQAWILPIIAAVFAVMAVFLGFFACKKK